jgi:hypothetical protein
VDLGRLEGQDQAACFAACDADPGFLSTGDDEGQWGDLEVTLWTEEALKGSFDVLLSQGGLSGSFAAARCEMGLY